MGLRLDHDLVRWAREYPSSDAERSRLDDYQGSHRSHARLALAAWTAVPSWHRRASYLRAILAPQRAERRLPTRVRLRHGVDALRSWRT